jgi:glycosyltransferase involved in cell wall biosynthesis
MTAATPLFTIVIPAFNRAGTITRTIESVLSQDWKDVEIIIVDDGSTDATRAIAEGFASPRLRVLAHARNRGVCPARNTGIEAARGSWIVFLDSDDEFAGTVALSRMAALARTAEPEIAALWFRSRADDGALSPPRLPALRELDYRAYLGFLEATHGLGRDMIRCVRRSCFTRLRYPDSRMLEDKFHLDFARLFRSRLHEDVLRLYHQDAPERLVMRLGRLDPARDREFILARARGLALLLAVHGAALARTAPRVFAAQLARALSQALLAARAAPRRTPAGGRA